MHRCLTFILFFFLIEGAYAQDLSATMKMPEVVVPGEDYVTEITINKGPINSYIKFSQKVPIGFRASEIDTRGGNFTFDDSIIKIVWFFPPANSEFTFSYKVHVPDDASGVKKIGGKIYYFFNTDREVFSFEKHFISVGKEKKDIVSTAATKITDTASLGNPTVKEVNIALANSLSKAKADTVSQSPIVINDTTNSSVVKSVLNKDSVIISEIQTPLINTPVAIKDTMILPVSETKVNSIVSNTALATNDTLKIKDTSHVAFVPPLAKIVVKDTLITPIDVAIKKEEKKTMGDSALVVKTETKSSNQVKNSNNVKPPLKQEEKSVADSGGLRYCVQLGTFKEEVPLETANRFLQVSAKGFKNLKENNGYTTFVVGNFRTKEDAAPLRNQMLEKGFQGAFVIEIPTKNNTASAQSKGVKSDLPTLNKTITVANSDKIPQKTVIENKEEQNPSISKVNKISDNLMVTDTSNAKRTYSVQIGAFKEEVPLETANKFLKIAAKGVKNLKNDMGFTVYTVGNFASREQALTLRNELIEKGFQGAFVVAFEHGAIMK